MAYKSPLIVSQYHLLLLCPPLTPHLPQCCLAILTTGYTSSHFSSATGCTSSHIIHLRFLISEICFSTYLQGSLTCFRSLLKWQILRGHFWTLSLKFQIPSPPKLHILFPGSFFLHHTYTIWHEIHFALCFIICLSAPQCKLQEVRKLCLFVHCRTTSASISNFNLVNLLITYYVRDSTTEYWVPNPYLKSPSSECPFRIHHYKTPTKSKEKRIQIWHEPLKNSYWTLFRYKICHEYQYYIFRAF